MLVRMLGAGIVVSGAMVSLALSAAGQTAGCWFPLTVEIVGGHPSLQKLSEKNLEVRVGGRATKVRGIDLKTATQVIVVMDTSGSMQSYGWKGLGMLVDDLLRGAPSNVKEVGLTVFGDAAIHAHGLDDSLRLLDETMKRGPYGRTKLLDTLLNSARYFRAGANTLMIVITDGGDNRSLKSWTDDRRELLSRGVRTTFIIPRYQKPGTVEEMLADDLPRELADATGGNTIYLSGIPEDTNHIFAPDVTRKLLAYYKVEIPPSSGKLKVEVREDSGKKARDLKLHYPRESNCAKQF